MPRSQPKPVAITGDVKPIECCQCGEEIEDFGLGVYAEVRDSDDHVEDVYWAHKNDCDRTLEAKARRQGHSTRWEDLSDMIIPREFLKAIMASMNRQREDERWSDQAFDKWKKLLILLAQYVVRPTTSTEREALEMIDSLPAGL
jgi:hypothetical protein